MILEKLVAYYNQQIAREDSPLAPYGFQRKRLDWLIVIAGDGTFRRLEATKNLAAGFHVSYLLPAEVKRSRQVEANLLWDNASYVLGIDRETKGQLAFLSAEFFPLRVQNFYTKLKTLSTEINDEGLSALCLFYEQGEFERCHNKYKDVIKGSSLLSFQLEGDDRPIASRPLVFDRLQKSASDGPRIRCSVTGDWDELAQLHPNIKGLKGALPTGSTLISFNQESARFFSKDQGANATIGKRSAFAYSEALNHLLRPHSGQLVTIGDLSLIFWADDCESFSDGLRSSLGFTEGQAGLDRFVADLKARRWAGETGDFCILGLSASKARIAVKTWLCGSIAQWSDRLLKFYDELNLVHAPYEAPYLSIFAVGAAMAPDVKIGDIESRCMIELLEAIFHGESYPHSIFYITMNLIRKEKQIGYQRASLIKAYLLRAAKLGHLREEALVALDRAYENVGYCLGRLFAVLEKLQEESNAGLFSNVRERYYTTASTAPAAAFPLLMRQKNSNLGRIQNPRKRENFEQEIGGIVMNIKDIPKNLQLADQGRFAIGYYHQRQDFYQTHGD